MTKKMTSKEWQNSAEYKGCIIMDPDGWNRKDLNFSFFEEEITREEFAKRLGKSTVMYPKNRFEKANATA
jgi:hypothetical protein